MSATMYYEDDANHALVAARKVAVLGFGSQGHAHALNLKDSGIDVSVGLRPGSQTRGVTLGVSRVGKDPANREFYYMIAVEKPAGCPATELESNKVPASQWAVFECHGRVPEAIVKAEIYAFTQWLPASGFVHAHAPEMEVYPPESQGDSDDNYCEFWLPIERKK